MRIGIYGGSFSPPHNGHIDAVKSFHSSIMLDKVLVMPTYIAPHKQTAGTLSVEHRLEMTRLAFKELDFVTVSDYEIKQKTVSYTANTLTHFASKGELFFLCGSDMFLTLDSWYRPDLIFQHATIVLASRDATLNENCLLKKAQYEKDYGARIIILKNPVIKLSSTEVREAIRSHQPVDTLIPRSVEAYIRENNLYE